MLTDLLADAMARTEVAATLGLEGKEVVGSGRQTVDGWEVTDGTASATVRFGPFGHPVEFDEVWLHHPEFGSERMRLDGRVRLLTGMVYEHTTNVRVRRG